MKNSLVAVIAILILVFTAGCNSVENNRIYADSSKYAGYPTYEEVVRFHGHSCPGSMMGYRMTIAGMETAKAAGMDPKELCAIVENNACGVDALQVASSFTFGKKKIIFHDYGKSVYTFFSPKTKKGFRVSLQLKEIPDNVKEDREAFTNYLFEASDEDILVVTETMVTLEIPQYTRESIPCPICKESVNINRTTKKENMKICIPCAER
jgi:formylmethanofuran dehydrogenase subunit E